MTFWKGAMDLTAKKRKDRSATEGTLPALGDLLGGTEAFGSLPAGPTRPAEGESTRPEKSPARKAAGKIIVRTTRKGRGGHSVTLVEFRGREKAEVAGLARTMGKALGCGSRVEEGQVVLQGDQVDRAEAWLGQNGYVPVVRGG